MIESGTVFEGRMFRNMTDDYQAFFDYGIGAMCWQHDPEGRRELLFIAPAVDPDPGAKPWVLTAIYTSTDGKDWKNPGPVNGWDGNVERPTFNPSIWLLNRKGWHGWIREGNLVTA